MSKHIPKHTAKHKSTQRAQPTSGFASHKSLDWCLDTCVGTGYGISATNLSRVVLHRVYDTVVVLCAPRRHVYSPLPHVFGDVFRHPLSNSTNVTSQVGPASHVQDVSKHSSKCMTKHASKHMSTQRATIQVGLASDSMRSSAVVGDVVRGIISAQEQFRAELYVTDKCEHNLNGSISKRISKRMSKHMSKHVSIVMTNQTNVQTTCPK